ncbi:putative ribonuclease H-like domain-containing protein [Tanacetum coccineum]
MTDYSLWEVILNGNKVLKRTVGRNLTEYEPTYRRNNKTKGYEMKLEKTLLLESKEVQRILLKQQYENFTGSSSETMDQTFDRLQKLISQLEIQGEVITQKDMNLKLLRSLQSEWKTHSLIWRNKEELETISLDDFINRNSSTNETDNTAYGVTAAHTQSNPTSGDNLMETPIENALVAQDGIGGKFFQFRSEVDFFVLNLCLESVEARLAHYKKNEVVFEESINVLNLEVKLRDNALVENKKKLEKAEKERDELKLTLEKFQNSSKSLNNLLESQVCDKFKTGLGYNAASPAVESFVNSSEMLENQEYNKSKSDKGYHAVPPPYTGNFIPSKPDLTFMDEISADVKNNGDAVEPKTIRKNSFRPPVIEDWNSDDDSEVEFIPNVKDKTVRPSTEKIKFIKSENNTVGARHMTGNKCYLTEYEDYDGGFVSFGDGKGTRDNIVAGPKDSEEDVGMKPTELKEIEACDKGCGIAVGPSFTNDDPSSPVMPLKASLHLRILLFYINKQRRTNHKDYQNCLFACFLSQKEPKKVIQALADPSWVEAMQEELLQFKLQKVWTLVDLPNGKRAIGTKWVFKNKKDERGIIVRNIARLVVQGYTQKEGIDYDESAFLYGTIEEEVYVCQPPGFEDPHFPNKVYKVEKALYGLHQVPRAWYETLSTYLIENGFRRGAIDKTLFIKKDKGDILLVQVYVDDIIFGSTKKSLCDEFEGLMTTNTKKKIQMSSMGELTFFLGLQVQQKEDGIFISQDKYVAEILKKFDFATVKTTSTP